jgi:hypothetical protein
MLCFLLVWVCRCIYVVYWHFWYSMGVGGWPDHVIGLELCFLCQMSSFISFDSVCKVLLFKRFLQALLLRVIT